MQADKRSKAKNKKGYFILELHAQRPEPKRNAETLFPHLLLLPVRTVYGLGRIFADFLDLALHPCGSLGYLFRT